MYATIVVDHLLFPKRVAVKSVIRDVFFSLNDYLKLVFYTPYNGTMYHGVVINFRQVTARHVEK